MRLSWYADSQIAVFSIWQAGRCTGTFRLPFADLDRMIETLRRGPEPSPGSVEPGAPGGLAGYPSQGYAASDYHAPGYEAPGYASPGYEANSYPAGSPEPDYDARHLGPGYPVPAYPGPDRAAYDVAAHEAQGIGAGQPARDYVPGYPPRGPSAMPGTGAHELPGYEPPGYQPPGYDAPGVAWQGGGQAGYPAHSRADSPGTPSGYQAGGYARPDYGGGDPGFPEYGESDYGTTRGWDLSGGTAVGEPDPWQPPPASPEWPLSRPDHAEEEPGPLDFPSVPVRKAPAGGYRGSA